MDNEQIEAIGAIFPAIGRVLGEIRQLLYEQSDLEPVGMYAHGSLAMNCFQLGRSDLDLLVVNQLPATPAHRRRWAAGLAAISGAPCPVELSVVQQAQVEPWQHPTSYDFHWSEAWRDRYAQAQADVQAAAVWDAPAAPDPDLAAHFTVARQRGLCLAGEPVAALPVVPWADYLDSIRRDLDWAGERLADDPVYAVLNACRVWAAVAGGLVLSKAEGVGWAAAQMARAQTPVTVTQAVIQAVTKAGTEYTGQAGVQVTEEEAQVVVAYVQGRLKKAPATT